MYDTKRIPCKHQQLTASSDDFGLYGSVFASDAEHEIPTPPNLYNEPISIQPTYGPSESGVKNVP